MTHKSERAELMALADELARDAATYAAGTPTRKLLHKAADALRRLAAAPLGDVREANFALLDFARNVAGLDEGALTRADLNYFRSLIREWRDEARAALDALVPAGGVGIKPLEWEKHPDDDEWYSYDHGNYDICDYIVYQSPASTTAWCLKVRGHLLDEDFASADDAKAAARADYERRIRAALAPQNAGEERQQSSDSGGMPRLPCGMHQKPDGRWGCVECNRSWDASHECVRPSEATPAPASIYPIESAGMRGAMKQAVDEHKSMLPAPAEDAAVAWMMPEHIEAYRAGTSKDIAWANPERSDDYTVPLYLRPAKAVDVGARSTVIRLLWEKQFEKSPWANKFHLIRPDSLEADYGALADKIIAAILRDGNASSDKGGR